MPGEIVELLLVVFDGQNRHIHEGLQDAQVCLLRNIGVRVRRIQGNQRKFQTYRPDGFNRQPGVI
jgi:hypothetical protein